MPADMRRALTAAKLMAAYKARPAYQQNDYIGWITRAKLASTRERRLAQMLTELKGHDRYMKMPYRVRSASN
jgi:uncharacterized protein YdeI (YjbR/CyaY-like superfamily)